VLKSDSFDVDRQLSKQTKGKFDIEDCSNLQQSSLNFRAFSFEAPPNHVLFSYSLSDCYKTHHEQFATIQDNVIVFAANRFYNVLHRAFMCVRQKYSEAGLEARHETWKTKLIKHS
jgi:hypothetical protein